MTNGVPFLYDRRSGEQCGYDRFDNRVHGCTHGFACNANQKCSDDLVFKTSEDGGTCGFKLHGGAVSLECEAQLVCVDNKCRQPAEPTMYMTRKTEDETNEEKELRPSSFQLALDMFL